MPISFGGSGRSGSFRSRRGGNTFRGSRSFNNRARRFQGTFIHPSRFINKARDVEQRSEFVPQHKFSDFAISDALKRNISARGYTTPTPIQDSVIPLVLEGKDVIGLANTGTGKTAAFIVPIINWLQTNQKTEAVLIVAPTRELAQQIDEEFRVFSGGLRLFSALCIGGASMHRQIMALARHPHVVIGTPGRLKDLVEQNRLRLGNSQILVLDEVDRMMDMGFINDIRFLIGKLPGVKQSLSFSATLTPTISRLVQGIMRNPVTISVRTSETVDTVEQDVLRAGSKEQKIRMLTDLLRQQDFEKVLIFGQTKHGVQRLAEDLTKSGHRAEAIHGNKSQPQRERALRAFKDNRVRVLVATDVAARGLDIPDVSHVINFDQPNTYEDYIHRIGRTGRAGKKGQALTFVNSY
ncbi:MAG: DEAD/DEAH box helicase [Patescibacteria group bacterium]